jgi:hypothetical protein
LTIAVSDESEHGELTRAEPPSATIVCVDCGGVAHLLTPARDDGEWYVGDISTYRCSDCRDRWDLVME